MSATTRISFDEFLKIQESEERISYELDEGELIVTPSPTIGHNEICFRIHRALRDFVLDRNLGYVTAETDFRLGPDTVRRPDIAFITAAHLRRIDINQSPVQGAPALAVEVISPSNTADDTTQKIHQYLATGGDLVWVVYPRLKLVEIHDHESARSLSQGFLQADKLFPGFTLSLAELFDAGIFNMPAP